MGGRSDNFARVFIQVYTLIFATSALVSYLSRHRVSLKRLSLLGITFKVEKRWIVEPTRLYLCNILSRFVSDLISTAGVQFVQEEYSIFQYQLPILLIRYKCESVRILRIRIVV